MKEIIMRYIKPYFPQMGAGFVIKFIGTIMDLFIPYILAHIIDAVIPTGEKAMIFLWGAGMITCSFLAVLFNIIANRKASRVASDVTRTLRHDLFEKIMYLSNHQMDAFTKPSLISRMTSDTYDLQQSVARIQRMGVRAPILLVGGIFITFTLDYAMALVLVAALPLIILLSVVVSGKGIPIYAKQQAIADRMVRVVREDIAGVRVIKALSKTDYETEKFRDVNKNVVEQEKKAGMVMAVMNPAMTILLNLGLVGVILVGAYRVNAGTSEVGKILAFTTYFTIILNAMMSITRIFSMVSKSIASGNRIWEVLGAEEEMKVQKEQGPARLPGRDMDDVPALESEGFRESGSCSRGTGPEGAAADEEIRFDHVIFSYYKRNEAEKGPGTEGGREGAGLCDGGKAAEKLTDMSPCDGEEVPENLTDISFCVKKGENLGIIGEIGSGKSTILNLMMRLYDADGGRIEIAGRDIRSYEPDELKRKFGVVFQNDMIFEDTIAGNVSLGREMSAQQIQEALLYAQASEFVEGRQEQEEDALNIRGANLSGGQKQRVLIARALAARPEILILDDSSSALDYQTDARLRQGIREHFADTTLVIVAQRVSSIRHADHILVLENGHMIGYGTHEELMEGCSVYQEIAHSQMGEIAGKGGAVQ